MKQPLYDGVVIHIMQNDQEIKTVQKSTLNGALAIVEHETKTKVGVKDRQAIRQKAKNKYKAIKSHDFKSGSIASAQFSFDLFFQHQIGDDLLLNVTVY